MLMNIIRNMENRMMNLNFNGFRCVYCAVLYNKEDRKGEAAFICDECDKPNGKRSQDTLKIKGISKNVSTY